MTRPHVHTDPDRSECEGCPDFHSATHPVRPHRPEETPMTRTVRTQITALDQLAPGDTVVRRFNDESYTVEHVGRRHALIVRPTTGVERSVHIEGLRHGYLALRPEPLPNGLELTETWPANPRSSAYQFTDWAGDTARVVVSREPESGPVVIVSDNLTSVHFDPETLRYLLAQAEALAHR